MARIGLRSWLRRSRRTSWRTYEGRQLNRDLGKKAHLILVYISWFLGSSLPASLSRPVQSSFQRTEYRLLDAFERSSSCLALCLPPGALPGHWPLCPACRTIPGWQAFTLAITFCSRPGLLSSTSSGLHYTPRQVPSHDSLMLSTPASTPRHPTGPITGNVDTVNCRPPFNLAILA